MNSIEPAEDSMPAEAKRWRHRLSTAWVLYCGLALPLLAVAVWAIFAAWVHWNNPDWDPGPMETRAPTVWEKTFSITGTVGFAVVYVATYLSTRFFNTTRWVWVVFAVQMPPLWWLIAVVCWPPIDDRRIAAGITGYLGVLLVVLTCGVYFARRMHLANGRAGMPE